MDKLDKLLTYHEAQMAYDDLETMIRSTPSRLRFNKLHEFLTQQQNALARLEKDIGEKSLTVAKLEELLNTILHKYDLELSEIDSMTNDDECTCEEVIESRRELESLLSQVTIASRDLFDAVAWIEKTTVESKNIMLKAQKAKKEYDTVRLACNTELEGHQDELKRLSKDLEEKAAALPPEMLQKYKSVRLHHAIPLAKLEGNQCGGCNMSLPTSVVKRVSNSESIVECENCGRILYLA